MLKYLVLARFICWWCRRMRKRNSWAKQCDGRRINIFFQITQSNKHKHIRFNQQLKSQKACDENLDAFVWSKVNAFNLSICMWFNGWLRNIITKLQSETETSSNRIVIIWTDKPKQRTRKSHHQSSSSASGKQKLNHIPAHTHCVFVFSITHTYTRKQITLFPFSFLVLKYNSFLLNNTTMYGVRLFNGFCLRSWFVNCCDLAIFGKSICLQSNLCDFVSQIKKLDLPLTMGHIHINWWNLLQ